MVSGDAALTDHYAGMVPAYLVLACGVFGNITDDDVRRTIGYCTQLCAHGGTVVWTRGRWEPDLVPLRDFHPERTGRLPRGPRSPRLARPARPSVRFPAVFPRSTRRSGSAS